ncbi:MAG: hypothetical protein WCC06_00335 [Candidatus Aminicenantales bacterium]
MKYKFTIPPDMSPQTLNQGLIEYFKFHLINFAHVIADVFAGKSIFTKKINGITKHEIENEIKELIKIREKVTHTLKVYFNKYYLNRLPTFSNIKEFKGLKILEKHILSIHGLDPFMKNINNQIAGLEKKAATFRYENEVIKKYFPMPFREGKKARERSYTNQICFLWALAMRNEAGEIAWKNIAELLNWFGERLKDSCYWGNIKMPSPQEITSHDNPIKSSFKKIKRNLSTTLNYAKPFYFFRPIRAFAGKSLFRDSTREGVPVLRLVRSVKFYKGKIKVIFEKGNRLRTRETFLENKKYYSIIRNYSSREEKSDRKILLLEINQV